MNAVNAELSIYWDDFEFWIDFTTMSTDLFHLRKNCIIYTNPVYDFINIQSGKDIIEIQIFDLSGKLHKTIDIGFRTLNLNSLKSGIYNVSVLFINNRKEFFKVIKN